MKQSKSGRKLAFGEYILPEPSQNTEIAGARWMLMQVVSRVSPRFFVQLRDLVYPVFAPRVENSPDHWEAGWTFQALQQSDSDQQLTRCLVTWARRFHAEEPWILEGALQTLWLWHRKPELRKSLDIGGFRSSCCVDTLSSDEERIFSFENSGWDPQFQTFASFRDSIKERFQNDLDSYRQRLSSLMNARGAVLARKRYSVAHFKWFALHQFGGMPFKIILGKYSHLKGDESTILKGVKLVAGLLQWERVRKERKART